MSQPYKNWCFTLNNYCSEDEQVFRDIPSVYLVYGREVGDEGTPHLQGYIQLTKPIRLTGLKKLHPKAHWEPAKGDQPQNLTYCSKQGDYEEHGIPTRTSGGKPTQEERAAKNKRLRDLDLALLVDTGEISIKETRALKNARLDLMEEESQKNCPKTLDGALPHQWYCGPSRTGKSRKAREENPDAYLKMCNKWWDAYKGESVVLIEDFDRKHEVLAHHLKLWADRYPFLAEIKGSTRKIRPGLIIVTSNYHPRDIWTDTRDLEPILERFQITHFNELTNIRKEEKRASLEVQDKEENGTALSVEGKPGSRYPLGDYHPCFNYGQ
jgi:hypothetical protein